MCRLRNGCRFVSATICYSERTNQLIFWSCYGNPIKTREITITVPRPISLEESRRQLDATTNAFGVCVSVCVLIYLWKERIRQMTQEFCSKQLNALATGQVFISNGYIRKAKSVHFNQSTVFGCITPEWPWPDTDQTRCFDTTDMTQALPIEIGTSYLSWCVAWAINTGNSEFDS